jgi:hypothetical protein
VGRGNVEGRVRLASGIDAEVLGKRIELTVEISESTSPLRLLLLGVGRDTVEGRVGLTVGIEIVVVGKRTELTVEISESTSLDMLFVKLSLAVEIDSVEGKEMLPVGVETEIDVVGIRTELTVDTSEATSPDKLPLGTERVLTVDAETDKLNCSDKLALA